MLVRDTPPTRSGGLLPTYGEAQRFPTAATCPVSRALRRRRGRSKETVDDTLFTGNPVLTVEVLRKSRFSPATSYVQVGKVLGSGLSKRRLDLEWNNSTNVREAQVKTLEREERLFPRLEVRGLRRLILSDYNSPPA